jgi:hypothetical protein
MNFTIFTWCILMFNTWKHIYSTCFIAALRISAGCQREANGTHTPRAQRFRAKISPTDPTGSVLPVLPFRKDLQQVPQGTERPTPQLPTSTRCTQLTWCTMVHSVQFGFKTLLWKRLSGEICWPDLFWGPVGSRTKKRIQTIQYRLQTVENRTFQSACFCLCLAPRFRSATVLLACCCPRCWVSIYSAR